jgi:hypothetical protein
MKITYEYEPGDRVYYGIGRDNIYRVVESPDEGFLAWNDEPVVWIISESRPRDTPGWTTAKNVHPFDPETEKPYNGYHFLITCGICEEKITCPWDRKIANEELWKHAVKTHMDFLCEEAPPTGCEMKRVDKPVCPWCYGSGTHRGTGTKCMNSLFHNWPRSSIG